MKNIDESNRWRSMSDNVVRPCIHSIHQLAGIYSSMTSLTDQIHLTQEQHAELRKSLIDQEKI